MEKKKLDCPEIDRQLIERFASGNGTVFVGAGISMRSKLPSWAQLIEPLREELGTSVSPSASHFDVAEQYEAAHGRSAMVRYLKRATGDVRYQASHAHDLIVSLPVQRIYTTNFDDLLERAAHKKGINRRWTSWMRRMPRNAGWPRRKRRKRPTARRNTWPSAMVAKAMATRPARGVPWPC